MIRQTFFVTSSGTPGFFPLTHQHKCLNSSSSKVLLFVVFVAPTKAIVSALVSV